MHSASPDDLHRPFGKFGPVKDIYLPKDYYTRRKEPKGFGFIQYFDPEDASNAKYHMDGKMLLGREIDVVFAEENRKKPSDMRARKKKWQRPFL
uniref:RRM domain-containing protein n=1 Tax=Zea mays TaxID=4577 RepID=A0A804MIT1_MAIZE